MKKVSALIVSILMLSAVANGGVYRIGDDWLGNMWLVDSGAGLTYSNQFVLFATLTDSGGSHLPDKALVLFDTTYGNINLIIFGFSCTISFAWNLSPASALLGYLGDNPLAGEIWYQSDSIFLQTLSLAGRSFQSGSNQADRESAGGAGSAEADPITVADVSDLSASAAAVPKTPQLTSGFGHTYYLDSLYEVYPSIYVYTMTVQGANGTADGLLFFQRIPSLGDNYFVIITVFESNQESAYSMVGLYNPYDTAARSHYFVVLGRSGGSTTTLY